MSAKWWYGLAVLMFTTALALVIVGITASLGMAIACLVVAVLDVILCAYCWSVGDSKPKGDKS